MLYCINTTNTFDESVKGWTSFYSYVPSHMFSLFNRFYTFDLSGDLWQHYSESSNRSSFYGTNNNSTVTSIFNIQPSLSKSFKTVNYEGDSNWALNSFITNEDSANAIGIYVVPTTLAGMEEALLKNEFKAKENKYFANLINTSTVNQGEVVYGKDISGIKGFYSIATFSATNTAGASQTNELFAVSTEFTESSY